MARRPRSPGWVPNQHGAWAMLLAPLVTGAVLGGLAWTHLLLLVAWLVAYLAFYATGLWLRAHRRRRYRPPVVVYGVATAVLGGSLVVAEPELLRWAPVYAVLLAVSLWHSVRRRDRALLNDVVTILAACLMCVVAHGLGPAGTGAPSGWPLPGAGSGQAWTAAVVLLTYFVGTVLHVKTMIRSRGSVGMRRASVTYHLIALAGAAVAPLPGVIVAVFTVLAVRAWLIPRRWPGMSPARLGVVEIVATVALVVGLLLG